MAKDAVVLGIEGDVLRGVRLGGGSAFWRLATAGAADDGAESAPAGADEGAASGADAPGAAEQEADGAEVEQGLSLGEAFKAAKRRFGAREVVLSLPLSRMLVKVVRVPLERRDEAAQVAAEALDGESPFSDEELLVASETLLETDSELVTLVAALPEASRAGIDEALEAAGLRVVRTDATALGWLRALWPLVQGPGDAAGAAAAEGAEPASAGRRLVLMDLDDGWDLAVVDEGSIAALRGLGRVEGADALAREVMLTALQAPLGSAPREVVLFSRQEPSAEVLDRLGRFAPVRFERVADDFAGVEGVARRVEEGCPFDATPEVWAQALDETRFRRRLAGWTAAAAALWLCAMGTLFGVPMAYDQMTKGEKQRSKSHERAYREVKNMRERVKLVQRYSDHSHGSLEMLKMVSDRMPDGVTLTSFRYSRDDKLDLAGEADDAKGGYELKNAIVDAGVFAEVELKGPSQRGSVLKFSIAASFVAKEDRK